MITLDRLTKRHGEHTAVDDLTLSIEGGQVTGFLGPNGAGKSTTMRMILGLDRPTSGHALIGGLPYARLRRPLREIGALLDAKAVHPGRSARAHLRALARTHDLPARRVDEVLDQVGLTDVAQRRAGTFSLGMSQRLGVASALIGDPRALVLDEPVNGLDPDGVRWIRELIRSLAAEGRAVFVSSHLMSEMEQTADRLVVLGKGRLIANAPVAELLGAASTAGVVVRSPDSVGLGLVAQHALADGARVIATDGDSLTIAGASIEEIGRIAHGVGVLLHELSPRQASLEQAYLELTADSVEYAAG
ncbi:ATP-binding cassette domain-containing protein [Streptomyces sp. SID3343]|uniref:ABC transporter ATP-binding protein n=1 Tax=Streptomyces sp. SID3343 TaxID=2690260 RepID=UPI001367F8F5|nr:ATP-binding cassette domain-containing protein [Streptomyces sp. SID3343]MYV98131.1 ATP-binding cassette domain-containing protein [Streptomyces sp. SID3343]